MDINTSKSIQSKSKQTNFASLKMDANPYITCNRRRYKIIMKLSHGYFIKECLEKIEKLTLEQLQFFASTNVSSFLVSSLFVALSTDAPKNLLS